MASVFLSYAHEDMDFVSRLHEALVAAGQQPAWDQDHGVVPFSSPYRAEIAAAITASDKFAFVITPDSLSSGPCAEEIDVAVAAGKQMIPLLRRYAAPGQVVPSAIAERNWIFFNDDR